MKYLSMFSGVGGFEEGFKRSWPEAECIGVSEIDPYASMILKYKYPEVKNYGDATKIKPEEIEEFDLLCGGFPCQAFSIAGNRMGFEDARGTLFFEIARIAKIKRPAVLFLENVKGLLNHEEGATLAIIFKTMDELGYDAEWQVLNSKHYGVPQNRERVFIIGHLRGKPWRAIFPIRADCKVTNENEGKIKQVVKSSREIKRIYDQKGISPTLHGKTGGWQEVKITTENRGKPAVFDRGKLRGTDHALCLDASYYKGPDTHGARTVIATELGNSKNFGNRSGSKEAYTITGSHPHGIIENTVQSAHLLNYSMHGRRFKGNNEESFTLNTLGEIGILENELRIRKLTPKECERLQGFPDDWTKYGINEYGKEVVMSDSQRYKMMGNAVTVNVVVEIIKRIKVVMN